MDTEQSALTPRTRLVWLLLLFVVQFLYIPINRLVSGGGILDTPWDAYIPFWPIWVVPYLLSLLWWAACFIWAAWKMPDALYRAFIAAIVAVMLSSYVVYVVFPTYVERPVLNGHSWETELVRLVYRNDRLHNAFPSGHAYNTMLIVFFWWNWKRRLRWLWVGFAGIIILSTLFTAQHNLPDPIGGIVWAYLGYRFGIWWAARQETRG
jgi:hypothetical protein